MAESDCSRKWTHESTKLLVDTRLRYEQDFIGKRKKKTVLWETVLKEMKKVDSMLSFSRDDITRKFLNLCVTYRRIKKRNSTSGEAATTWEYFELFDQVYGTRADINVPDNLLESSLSATIESILSDENTEHLEDVVTSPPPPKRPRCEFTEILLEDRTAHHQFMREFLDNEKEKNEIEKQKVEQMKKLVDILSNLQNSNP